MVITPKAMAMIPMEIMGPETLRLCFRFPMIRFAINQVKPTVIIKG
jgi:hypothetical protein